MKVMSAETPDGRYWFEYVTSHDASPTRVEWNKGDKLQLFPAVVSNALLQRHYAKPPSLEAVEWFENMMVSRSAAAPVAPLAAPSEPIPADPAPAAPAPDSMASPAPAKGGTAPVAAPSEAQKAPWE